MMNSSRRGFLMKGLIVTGLGAVGSGIAWILGSVWTAAARFSNESWVRIGPIGRFGSGSVTPFPEHRIAVIMSSRGIGAISMECTHLGCLVNVVDDGFFCPCHGSDFGPRGQVYSGPATFPLPWHEVMSRDGMLWVRTGEKTPDPQWLVLPRPSNGRSKEGRA